MTSLLVALGYSIGNEVYNDRLDRSVGLGLGSHQLGEPRSMADAWDADFDSPLLVDEMVIAPTDPDEPWASGTAATSLETMAASWHSCPVVVGEVDRLLWQVFDSSQLVLTARTARRIARRLEQQLHLRGKTWYETGCSESAEFKRIILRPDYSARQLRNDIGLIQLATDVVGAPVIINDISVSANWLGDSHNFVGFGVTQDGGGQTKRETDIRSIALIACTCTLDPDTNVCSGDSVVHRSAPRAPDVQVGVNGSSRQAVSTAQRLDAHDSYID